LYDREVLISVSHFLIQFSQFRYCEMITKSSFNLPHVSWIPVHPRHHSCRISPRKGRWESVQILKATWIKSRKLFRPIPDDDRNDPGNYRFVWAEWSVNVNSNNWRFLDDGIGEDWDEMNWIES
jgi:hypothetical protein